MRTFWVEYVFNFSIAYEINVKSGSDQVTDLAILQLACHFSSFKSLWCIAEETERIFLFSFKIHFASNFNCHQ